MVLVTNKKHTTDESHYLTSGSGPRQKSEKSCRYWKFYPIIIYNHWFYLCEQVKTEHNIINYIPAGKFFYMTHAAIMFIYELIYWRRLCVRISGHPYKCACQQQTWLYTSLAKADRWTTGLQMPTEQEEMITPHDATVAVLSSLTDYHVIRIISRPVW